MKARILWQRANRVEVNVARAERVRRHKRNQTARQREYRIAHNGDVIIENHCRRACDGNRGNGVERRREWAVHGI